MNQTNKFRAIFELKKYIIKTKCYIIIRKLEKQCFVFNIECIQNISRNCSELFGMKPHETKNILLIVLVRSVILFLTSIQIQEEEKSE